MLVHPELVATHKYVNQSFTLYFMNEYAQILYVNQIGVYLNWKIKYIKDLGWNSNYSTIISSSVNNETVLSPIEAPIKTQ